MNAQRFKADVDEALNVLWAFNHVMANGPSPPRDSELPFGQSRIKNALVYIYAAFHRDSVRAVIQQQYDAESASLFLSDQFRKAIVSHLTHLPKFRPDTEAAVVGWVRSLQVPLPPAPLRHSPRDLPRAQRKCKCERRHLERLRTRYSG